MAELPIAPVKRLAKSKDRDIRIGEDATALLIKNVEKIITKIAEESGELAKYAGRKTIQPADIEMAMKKLSLNFS